MTPKQRHIHPAHCIHIPNPLWWHCLNQEGGATAYLVQLVKADLATQWAKARLEGDIEKGNKLETLLKKEAVSK